MSNEDTLEEQFRGLVVSMKKMNHTWRVANIADEVKSYEKPPSLHRHALRRKINRILERGTIKDKSRCGAPRTVRTEELKKEVKRLIYLKKGQSQRKVVFELQRNNIASKRTSMQRMINELCLKPFKLKKAQKLIKRFGAKENSSKWKWSKIVNTDFSGIFAIEGIHNSKNNVIYADLREALVVKYPNGIMFWGAITTKGLVP